MVEIVVRELEPAIRLFTDVLGFAMVRRQGSAAELELDGTVFVLSQSTESEAIPDDDATMADL